MAKCTSFRDAVLYLESFILPANNHPGYYRNLNLDRTFNLLSHLGNPHKNYPIIHISGTSGKGSTALMSAAILESAGYKVGLHTSPHLQKVTERYLINRQLMPDEILIDYCNLLKEVVDRIVEENPENKPSYFELLVVLAFLYFSDQHVDYGVIEVGMGGRFDATNVCQPKVAVLTNVGLDHTQILGDTIEKIVQEKMMIIKPNTVAVTGVTQASALELVREHSRSVGAPLLEFGRDIAIRNYRVHGHKVSFDYISNDFTINNLELGLLGRFQAENASLAISATRALKNPNITEEVIRKALTGLAFPGRIEIRDIENKTLIIDGAHNPMKMAGCIETIQALYPDKKFPIIFGAKYDKDLKSMLTLLKPIASEFILTSFHSMTDFGTNVMAPSDQIENDIKQLIPELPIQKIDVTLLREVLKSHPEPMFVVTGSLYLVGAVRGELHLSWDSHQDTNAQDESRPVVEIDPQHLYQKPAL